jgi:hypothetical protein
VKCPADTYVAPDPIGVFQMLPAANGHSHGSRVSAAAAAVGTATVAATSAVSAAVALVLIPASCSQLLHGCKQA